MTNMVQSHVHEFLETHKSAQIRLSVTPAGGLLAKQLKKVRKVIFRNVSRRELVFTKYT